MELLLLRHAHTKGNLEGRYIGRTDEPLCAQGRASAAARAGEFLAERVFISPMQRAKETALLLFPAARLIVVPAFCEMDFVSFENKNFSELQNDPAYRRWVDEGCLSPCPGAESFPEFASRVTAAFYSLACMEQAAGHQKIAIVAHGGTNMAILEKFALPKQAYYNWYCANCHGWQAKLAFFEEELSLSSCVPV